MRKLVSKTGSTLTLAIVMLVVFSILAIVVVSITARTANRAVQDYDRAKETYLAKNYAYYCLNQIREGEVFNSSEAFTATYSEDEHVLTIKNKSEETLVTVKIDASNNIIAWRNH